MEQIVQAFQTVLVDFGVQKLPFAVLVRVVIMILVGAVVIRVLLKIVDGMLDRAEQVASIQVYIRGGIRIGLWFLLILVVAGSIGVDVSSLIALLSVTGLAVSLALQNTLSNLAGGIQLLASKAFQVGDYVEMDKGAGTVAEIGLSYTKLITADNKEVLIPNSQMASSNITNYTALGNRRVDVNINLGHSVDQKKVELAAAALFAGFPQIQPQPEPVVRVVKFGESTIEYSLRAWVSAQDYWDVYFGMMDGLKAALAGQGISLPHNQLDVHVMERN